MGREARDMLNETAAKRGTIADETYVAAVVRKWGRLLEGMPDRTPQQRYNLGVAAMLFENQSNDLRSMSEDVRTANVGSFTKFIFPILRRVFPNLIANEIVSVQPMTAPTGSIFYMDYIYGTSKGPTTAGNIFPRDFDRDYTSEFVNGEVAGIGNGTDFGGAGAAFTTILSFSPVRPRNVAQGYSVIVRELNVTTGATVQEATDAGDGSFTGAVASGTINYSNGALTNFKFTAAVANTNPIKVYYYYDGEMSGKVPQASFDIKQAPIQATSRRVKAMFSSEASEDLRALHGIDADTEIVSMTASEMALEIDREIINDIFAASGGTTGTFDRIPGAGIAELNHLRSMLTVISTVSSLIYKKTLRAPANWLVTSPEVSALLAQLTTNGDFRAAYVSGGDSPYGPADMPRPQTQHGQAGIYKVGTLQNKWMLYEDPFFTRDRMLVGLKGGSYLEAGYAWCPYVPLSITNSFLDPNDFSIRKGMRTRYGRKLLRSEYYGNITISNL
jgi:hypothetical protein